MVQEIWKDIPDYEGLYKVSNFGNIKSVRKNKIMVPYSNHGYLQLCLRKNNIAKTYKVHRLVAQAFIPNPNNLPCINHKDENPSNNYVNNLEWCSVEYNIKYGTRTEKTQKEIKQYDLDGNFIKNWKSIIEIERVMNIPHNNIIYCCQNKRKTAGNYMWKYAKEE